MAGCHLSNITADSSGKKSNYAFNFGAISTIIYYWSNNKPLRKLQFFYQTSLWNGHLSRTVCVENNLILLLIDFSNFSPDSPLLILQLFKYYLIRHLTGIFQCVQAITNFVCFATLDADFRYNCSLARKQWWITKSNF